MPPQTLEPITRSPGLRPVTPGPDRLDHAGDLAARRERSRRLELVAVLDDQNVGIVDPARLDHRSAPRRRPGLGIGHLLQDQRLGAADALAQHRFHAAVPLGECGEH